LLSSDHLVDDNLVLMTVLVFLVKMGSYKLRTLFISAAIPSSLGVLVGSSRGELVLN
jgi:hypothetical protein